MASRTGEGEGSPPAAARPAGGERMADGGPRYTETPLDPTAPDAPFPAEPWNAATAALFIALSLAWAVRLRGRFRRFPFLTWCLPVLFIGGVGGTLYHGYRTHRIYLLLDVFPIQILVLAGAIFVAARMWRVQGWIYAAEGLIAYVAVNTALFAFVAPSDHQLAISLNYTALAVLVLLPLAFFLIWTRFRYCGWVVSASISFLIGLFFRVVDARIGYFMPVGSHWLWHVFGAIATALFIEYFYRVENDPTLRRLSVNKNETSSP